MLYKFGQRCFPRLLFVVVQFAKFFGIHPRAFCHRYGSSGKPMPLLGEGPVFLVFHHGSFVKCRCTHSSMAEGLVWESSQAEGYSSSAKSSSVSLVIRLIRSRSN